MIEVEPKVYLLAETGIYDPLATMVGGGPPGVRQWLKDLDGLEVLDHISGSGPEQIIELSARRCYKALKPGLNPNVTKVRTDSGEYHRNILKSGHGSVLEHATCTWAFEFCSRVFTHEIVRNRVGNAFCLSGDTLVYSEHKGKGRRNGTKKYPISYLWELSQNRQKKSRFGMMKVRCLDEATRTFSVSPLSDVVRSGIKACFKVVLSDGRSVTCSKDHRFLSRDGWKSLDELAGGLSITEGMLATYRTLGAELVVNGQLPYRDAEWLYSLYHTGNMPISDIAREVGVSYHTIRAWLRYHRLQQRPKGRPSWNTGLHYTHKTPWTEEKRQLFSRMKTGSGNPQWRGGITCTATAIRREVVRLRPLVLQRDNFTCQLCGGVGGKLETHHEVPLWTDPDDPSRLNVIENLVTLCHDCHRGKVNSHELEFIGKFGRVPMTPGPCKEKPIGRPVLVPKYCSIKSIEYAGELETFDIMMPGPHHNFVANGVVTHNSQESLRYVRLTDLGFRMPKCIAENKRAATVFRVTVERLESAQRELAEIFAIDQMTNFNEKKILTSAFRRVAPIGLATGIVVTCNFRSLRWLIEQRTSLAAEEEIRSVLSQTAAYAVARWPLVFQDFKQNEVGEWVPEYRKV